MASADTAALDPEQGEEGGMGPPPEPISEQKVHSKARILITALGHRILGQKNVGKVSVKVDMSGDAGWAHHITMRRVVLSDANTGHPGAKAGWMDLTVDQAAKHLIRHVFSCCYCICGPCCI